MLIGEEILKKVMKTLSLVTLILGSFSCTKSSIDDKGEDNDKIETSENNTEVVSDTSKQSEQSVNESSLVLEGQQVSISHYSQSGFTTPEDSYSQLITFTVNKSKSKLSIESTSGTDKKCSESITMGDDVKSAYEKLTSDHPLRYHKITNEILMADCRKSGIRYETGGRTLDFPLSGVPCWPEYLTSDSIPAYLEFFNKVLKPHFNSCSVRTLD